MATPKGKIQFPSDLIVALAARYSDEELEALVLEVDPDLSFTRDSEGWYWETTLREGNKAGWVSGPAKETYRMAIYSYIERCLAKK